MSSIFKTFGTDKQSETGGVWVNYGDVRFLIARAGGANHLYKTVFQAKIKPYKHQIEKGLMPQEEQEKMTAEIFAEAVIRRVEVKQDEKWIEGLPTREGGVVEATREGLVALLLELPEMFKDILNCANEAAFFAQEEVKADVKNSKKS